MMRPQPRMAKMADKMKLMKKAELSEVEGKKVLEVFCSVPTP